MKSFLKNITLFSVPILIALAIPLIILRVAKESFYSIDDVIATDSKYLIGYAYHGDNYKYLKWKKLASSDKKSVIALGSSRVLQFRDKMFDTTFYNAGYSVSRVTDLKAFLQSLPATQYPEYLILGLDQWMFNKNWDDTKEKKDKPDWINSFVKYPDVNTCVLLYKDLFNGKVSLGKLQDSNPGCIGLNAIVNSKGFRSDGSMYYGSQIEALQKNDPAAEDYMYADTYERINLGINRFEYCDQINSAAIDSLSEFLSFCKKNNIYVVAFLPPYADKVYAKMNSSGKYVYDKELYNTLAPVVKDYGFELYDYSSVSSCNSNDNETLDGFHGGELTYTKILISILQKGSALNKVCTLQELEKDVQNTHDLFNVYGY